MAEAILENLRGSLLSRLDALGVDREIRFVSNAFIEFRRSGGIARNLAQEIELPQFRISLNQYGVPGRRSKRNVDDAFHIISQGNDAISFLQFKEWFTADEEGKASDKRRFSNSQLSVRGDSARLTERSNYSYERKEPTSPTLLHAKTQKEIFVTVERSRFSLEKFYGVLRKQISARNPGGSHGLLRCWKNFCRIAGARGGNVTKHEFGIALENYGLPLNDEDLQIVFDRTDANNNGFVDFDEWVDEVMGRWDPTVNTHDANKGKIYRGAKYKPTELLELRPQQVCDMLRQKILGRLKSGTHALLRCWKQFQYKAGAFHSGKISRAELCKAFENYGMPMSMEKSNEAFDAIDVKGDGVIDYKEFLVSVLKSHDAEAGHTSSSLSWNSNRDKEKLEKSRHKPKKRPQKVWVYDAQARGLISARGME